MIHIAICDDEPTFVNHFRQLLDRYSAESGEPLKLTACDDGLALIEQYDPTLDLIFLDIRMPLVDGLTAAEQVRRCDAEVGLIFLTTFAEYALEGYQYQATNYIVKPLGYARLKSDDGRFKVPLRSIRYIETYRRNLLVHAEQGDIVSYKSMKEMEERLAENDFVRCHTSFLVNLFYVKDVQKLELELLDGEHVPISQPKRKSVMARLADYWGDQL